MFPYCSVCATVAETTGPRGSDGAYSNFRKFRLRQ